MEKMPSASETGKDSAMISETLTPSFLMRSPGLVDDEVFQITEVLHGHRLIEAGVGFHAFQHVGGDGFFLGVGAAGHGANEEKGERNQHEQGDDTLGDAAENDADHDGLFSTSGNEAEVLIGIVSQQQRMPTFDGRME